ncbi:unnamed protein product [Calypogeia fissa]
MILRVPEIDMLVATRVKVNYESLKVMMYDFFSSIGDYLLATSETASTQGCLAEVREFSSSSSLLFVREGEEDLYK